MAQKKRMDARGRAIENEYRPISRCLLDGFVREALLRSNGPDGRLKAPEISAGLIAGLERQIGSSCRSVSFSDAVACRNDDSWIESDRRCPRHCSPEFSARRIGRQARINDLTMIDFRNTRQCCVGTNHRLQTEDGG